MPLTDAQREISTSNARFKVVAAGRRFGKTYLSMSQQDFHIPRCGILPQPILLRKISCGPSSRNDYNDSDGQSDFMKSHFRPHWSMDL